MNIQEYENIIIPMLNPSIASMQTMERMGYLIGKFSSEVGETCGEFCKKMFHGKNISREKFVDELGDIIWYYIHITREFSEDTKNKLQEILKISPKKAHISDESILADFMILFTHIGKLSQIYLTGKCTNQQDLETHAVDIVKNIGQIISTTIAEMQISLEEIITYNVDKLSKRYDGTSYKSSFYTTSQTN